MSIVNRYIAQTADNYSRRNLTHSKSHDYVVRTEVFSLCIHDVRINWKLKADEYLTLKLYNDVALPVDKIEIIVHNAYAHLVFLYFKFSQR